MKGIRRVLRRFERSVLGRIMRIGAKIADRKVAKELQSKRADPKD